MKEGTETRRGTERQRREVREMKKVFIIIVAIIGLFLVVRPAEAGHGHGGAFLLGFGLGFLLSPPVVYSAPPVYYAPAYPVYPRVGYYRDHGERASAPSRVWVRGYWEPRWNPYSRCWQRTWISGHWTRY